MKIGIRLQALRKSNGYSLKELSSLTDISISFLSDIENERSNPSIDNLKNIAVALNVPISYFLEDSTDTSIKNLIEDSEFMPILVLLKDYKDWNLEDKKELLNYLKAKQLIRKGEK